MTSDPPPHLRAYSDVIYDTLKELSETGRRLNDRSPLDSIAELVDAENSLPIANGHSTQTLEALIEVSRQPGLDDATAVADERFGSPVQFREALYFSAWLPRAAEVVAINNARHYVESATVPERLRDLVLDQDVILKISSFSLLWSEPKDTGAVAGSLANWRLKFTAAYMRGHSAFHRELATVVDAIDDLGPRATAVERLNGLRRLGPSVAATALEQFHELEHLYACSITPEALADALREAPRCPECGFELGAVAPTADARRVRQAIERGLLAQQRRLAQRVVSRLLEQPSRSEGERLARFVQVVQASDLGGLALVLDDAIIEFLSDFLEPPPRASEPDLVDRLATSFPEITLANIDAAVAEVRRLLTSDVVANGGLLRLGETRQDA